MERLAGPVLLNLLLRKLDDKESLGGNSRQLMDSRMAVGAALPEFWRRYEAYILAVLLGVCALVKVRKAPLDLEFPWLPPFKPLPFPLFGLAFQPLKLCSFWRVEDE